MKRLFALLLSFNALFGGLAVNLFAAEPPAAYANGRYNHLWSQSIVTNQPEEIPEPPEINDLEDWILVGSSKYTDRHTVTILNTKDQSQRITIPSKEASKLGFAILELKQDPRNFLRTQAKVQKGKLIAWLKYDEKFLRSNRSQKNVRTQKSTGKKSTRVRYVPKAKK